MVPSPVAEFMILPVCQTLYLIRQFVCRRHRGVPYKDGYYGYFVIQTLGHFKTHEVGRVVQTPAAVAVTNSQTFRANDHEHHARRSKCPVDCISKWNSGRQARSIKEHAFFTECLLEGSSQVARPTSRVLAAIAYENSRPIFTKW